MEKPIEWVGSSKEDLKDFPDEVMRTMGYSLHVAQNGGKSDNAKPLSKAVKGGGIYEVCDDYQGDTYRAVYTIKFEKAIYIIHAFKKKSKKGKSTPKPDMDLIAARYKRAEEHYKENYCNKRTKH